MRKIFGVALCLILLLCCCSRVEAKYIYEPVEPMCYNEPQKIRCTCYCEHGYTASGQWTREGTCAGKKEWLGYVCELNRVNEDGSVGEFIGYFEFTDTGAGMDSDGDGKGDTIRNGTSIDVWVSTRSEAFGWVREYGDYVYIKIIKGDG